MQDSSFKELEDEVGSMGGVRGQHEKQVGG
jgi:hypothetical protein